MMTSAQRRSRIFIFRSAPSVLSVLSIFLMAGSSQASHAELAKSFLPPNKNLFAVGSLPISNDDPLARASVKIRIKKWLCTGTLVSDNVVVTAAHCYDSVEGGVADSDVSLRVFLDSSGNCARAKVIDVRFVPGSERTDEGNHRPDLALVKLDRTLCGARPVEISDGAARATEILMSAGYGIGHKTAAPERIGLKLVDRTQATFNDLFSEFIPAKTESDRESIGIAEDLWEHTEGDLLGIPEAKDQGLCRGDSGSPLYREVSGKVQLLGVFRAVIPHLKRGPEVCQFGYVHLFSPLLPHRAWIEKTIRDWRLNPSGSSPSGSGPKKI